MRVYLVISLALGAIATSCFLFRGPGGNEPRSALSGGGERGEVPSSEASARFGSTTTIASVSGRPVIISDDFIQAVDWNVGGKWVKVTNRERTPTGQWETVSYVFDTSYEVFAVDGRQSDEFYIAGRTRLGEDILERWELATHTGARFVHINRASTAVGVPASPIPGSSGGIFGGGAYVPSNARTITPRQTRWEFYRGTAFHGVNDLSVDPEGRFVIVFGKLPLGLYRIPIQDGATPTLLYSSSQLSFLPLARSVYRMQHYVHGRVYILEGDPNAAGTFFEAMLFDSNNDGVFESTQTLAYEDFVAQGYMGQVWLSDFTSFVSSW